jgi:hypothetical protein
MKQIDVLQSYHGRTLHHGITLFYSNNLIE